MNRLDKVEAAADLAVESLTEAIEMITEEICDHENAHGAATKQCFAKTLFEDLAMIKKLLIK